MTAVRILVIAGRLGSGKTTAAYALAHQHEGTVITVSALLASLAQAAGMPNRTREQLQAFGFEAVRQRPHELAELITAVVEGSNLGIVDGLRSATVANLLRKQWREALRIVFLDAPQHLRAERYLARAGGEAEPFELVDNHEVELMAEEIRSLADFTVDATMPLAEVHRSIGATLKRPVQRRDPENGA